MEHTNEPPENRATGYAANGNVSEYVSQSGDILSHYDYSPFGELLIATSSHPAPFRFSTKYHDPETDTLYYGYRHYSPRLGRWLSRDPLEENGGENVFCFLANIPIGLVEILGLYPGMMLGTFDPANPYGDPFSPDPFSGAGLMGDGFDPYVPDTSDGLSYLEGGLNYLFGDGGTITIPISQLGLPTNLNSYIDPCEISNPEVHQENEWDSFQPLSISSWKKGGPGRIVYTIEGKLTKNGECCWKFVGDITVADDKFDFNPEEWGTRDKDPFWGQIPFRPFPDFFSNPLVFGFSPMSALRLAIGYPKETATRAIGTMGQLLGAAEFTIKFEGSLHVEEEGCCSK